MEIKEILLANIEGGLDIGLLILRVAIGLCFVVHALGKLGIVGPGNMDGFAAWLKDLGVPFAAMQARVAMSSELIGGACLALGFATRPAAFMLLGTMVVAMAIGHKGGGYLITNDPPGAEYTINLAAIMVFFLLVGPGVYSLDVMLLG
jgi:putative oxidoreductase